MKSETIALQQLFQDRRQYRVPFYQRVYVWNREDQWERLWTDIRDKADVRIEGGKTTPHFLGAVVLEPQTRTGLLGVETLHIIDGQQRITTLQYVLAALAMNLRREEQSGLLSLVEGCMKNSNPATMERPEVEEFKVWPTFPDRANYCSALSALSPDDLRARFVNSFTTSGTLRKVGEDHPPALEAIWYFYQGMGEWTDAGGEAQRVARLKALTEAVLRDLSIVSISLGEEDDAQIIFETLNGHGAQLNATDLIRNFVFMRADRDGPGAAQLYDTMWSALEDPFWKEEQRRGRLKRQRLEWFMQSLLEVKLRTDVDMARLYVSYRSFAGMKGSLAAREQLDVLTRYAEVYRHLISGTSTLPVAHFGRDIAPWDASTTHPLALAIATSACSVEEQTEIFADIVSYFVRRAICGLTAKSYNKVFSQQLKKAAESGVSHDAIRAALAEPLGDASRWPRDQEFRKAWLEGSVYPGRLDVNRARWVLTQLERGMRSLRSEEPLPLSLDQLDIDHILPTSWYEHWPLPDGTEASQEDSTAARNASLGEQPLSAFHTAIRARESLKATFGNLTLLQYGVNRGLQNHNMQKKGAALFAESNLHLNRALMNRKEWSEADIEARGQGMFEVARSLWKGPG